MSQTAEARRPDERNETWITARGRVIREWRAEQQLSQEKFARKVTISQAAMSNYESGKREMATGLFLNLARALEHEPQVLFERVSREAASAAGQSGVKSR